MVQEFRGKNVDLYPNGTVRFFDWTGRAVNDDQWELTHLATGQSTVYLADHGLLDLTQELMRVEAAGEWENIKGLTVQPIYGVMIYLAGYLNHHISHPDETRQGWVRYHHVYFPEMNYVEMRSLLITPHTANVITIFGVGGVPLLP